jgi:iron complex transport system permease protein
MIANALTLKDQKTTVILTFLAIALVVIFILALGLGQVHIPVKDTVLILLNKTGLLSSYTPDAVFETVLWNIRFPRLVMTVLIGASLAVSGAALQGLFRNPLVESGLIGVSGGAALSVVTLIVFGGALSIARESASMFILMPVMAFVGGLAATFIVTRISAQVGRTNIAVLILAGVAVNALTGALMGVAIFYADENQLRMFTFWTLGDLSGASWSKLLFAAPLLVLSTAWLLTFKNALNAIALGESEAYHMGVDVERTKKLVIFFSALAVGVSVSLSGIIGFVGLVIPHLIRVMFQPDNRLVLPASIFGGSILLILADLVARTLVSPSELPIGVVTGLVGAPFFIFLLMRAKSKQELTQ